MIRPEQPADVDAIRDVHLAAFPTAAEADLVDALRTNGKLTVSLVAVDDWQIVGHIAFSPVLIDGVERNGAGLAPVAVLPAQQSRGIGGRLIEAGLDVCRELSIDFVVVLGEPAYYRRFGFTPAGDFGLGNEYGAGEEFMAIKLAPGCLKNVTGLVRYGPEFTMFA